MCRVEAINDRRSYYTATTKLLCSGVVAGDARIMCGSFLVDYMCQWTCDELVDPKYQPRAQTTAETAVRGGGAGKRLRQQARAHCCPINWFRIALLLRTTAKECSVLFFWWRLLIVRLWSVSFGVGMTHNNDWCCTCAPAPSSAHYPSSVLHRRLRCTQLVIKYMPTHPSIQPPPNIMEILRRTAVAESEFRSFKFE